MKPLSRYLALSGLCALALTAHAQQWAALPEQPPIPADNPQSQAKIDLGKTLFFDPRLSEHGTLSCNSCHNVMAGGDDNRPNSIGMHDARGGRSAPTVWNAAYQSVQFWDGRAGTLEEQAKGPITNPIEMGMSDAAVAVGRLEQIPAYLPLFKAAFPAASKPITMDNVAKAIAAYERTLVTPDSPYDRYVKGDKTALTEQQARGMKTFGELGCTACHAGANFSGPPMPMAQGFFMKFPTFAGSAFDKQYDLLSDTGRHASTGKDSDKHMWRVPTLRNIALTAPYMHNGKVPTLEEAVRVMAKTQLNRDIDATQLADVVAFLTSLSGRFPEQTMPRLPLTNGNSIVPPIDPHLKTAKATD
ncbi:cytochrome-c peroxidase [Parazoarcus communis]|uniref:Methylamine utilization protein MauG n=1 Tax=Parazoarcus communis TaxID=41977 RepID=A0A2U8H038_9RHOO|nr:cytochrome c peroxidase [Parazoarcus communis]AWI78075.1 cytochrome-c peroxidase [Parazoarcus communis]